MLVAGQTAALAQAVRGELLERVGANPVGGAFVFLVDAAGTEVARALTVSNGTFLIQAPTAGSYYLISKRVGFRPGRSSLLRLGAGETITHRLVLDPIPVALAALVVEGERLCDLRSGRAGGGPSVVALWEEIREALASVVWSTREPGYWFSYATFERELTQGRRVVRESSVMREGLYRTPFASASPTELADRGYVVADGDEWVFFAPDAEVLLSGAFLEAHCFEVRIGKGENNGLLGLSFEPAPGNNHAEVTGTLWVDRESSELRYLEYRYTQVPRPLSDSPGGGRLGFRRVPSGAWIVDDWVIRMPIGRAGNRPAAAHVREVGGQVETVKRSDGTTIHSRAVAHIEGTVFDSILGRPLAFAEVSVSGTSYGVRADTAGRFRLEVPVGGLYALTFAHPRVDSLAFRPEPVEVTIQSGAVSSVQLAIPSDRSVVSRLCPDTIVRSTERVVVGAVSDGQSGPPAPGAEVIVTWQEIRVAPSRLSARDWQASGTTNDRGAYTLCALPSDRTIVFRGVWRSRESVPISLRFSENGVGLPDGTVRPLRGRVWRQDLNVAPSIETPIVDSNDPGRPLADNRALSDDTVLLVLKNVGFYDRRRIGAGRFVTREEFLQWSPTAITAVLVRIPGLVATVRGGRRIIDVRRGRTSVRSSCTPLVLLDNQPLGMSGELDLDASIPLEHVAAIEVYRGPSEVPAQFGGTACGLIAVWTR